MFPFQFVEPHRLKLPLLLNEQRSAEALTWNSPHTLRPYLGMCQMQAQFDVVLLIAQMVAVRFHTKFQAALFLALLGNQYSLSLVPEYQRCEMSQLNGQPTNFRVCKVF
jgi:hypothetical protein